MVSPLAARGRAGAENAWMRFPSRIRNSWAAMSHGFVALALLAAWAAPVPADTAIGIQRGDELYARGLLSDARAAYREAMLADPASVTALTRLARVESELAEDLKGEEHRQVLAAAVEHARAAVKAAPESAQAHVWLAVALGRQARKEGPKTRLALAREIKSEVDRAIALDPGIGRAYHVRGVWNRDIARLGIFDRAMAKTALGGIPKGATLENAIQDFTKAIELEPEFVSHHLELGRTYVIFHKSADARRALEKAVALPPTSSALDPRYQAEAKEMLGKLPKAR
jgi:tetratricopeptide (TPR) repeat protein